MNPLLLSTSVQKQAKERLGEKWDAKCFSYLGETVLIVQLKNENEVSELTDECDRFCRYAERIIGAVVTVGIGQVCEDILLLPLSYDSAREAVSYRVIYGASRAINMKEIAPREMSKSSSMNDPELSNLFKMIRLSSTEDITEAVQKYLKQLSESAKSLQQYNIAVMEMVSELYRFATNNDIDADDFLGDMRKLYSTLLDLDLDALGKWLIEISLSFRERLISARSKSTKSFVFRAMEYIHNNYR